METDVDPSSSGETLESTESKMIDGGYGWVIVGVCFFNFFCLEGLIGVYGLLYPDLLVYFGESPALTALPGSLIVGTFLLIGPIASELVRRYGCRTTTLLGSCISTLGLICSFGSPNIIIFLLCFGILTGFGVGLIYLPSATMVNIYFDRKRGIAQGIVTSGSGFGLIVLSPLTKFCLGYYGWRGTVLLWGGLFLNICIGALLMHPLRKADDQCSVDTIEIGTDRPEKMTSNEPEKENYKFFQTLHQNGKIPLIYKSNIEHMSTCSLPHIEVSTKRKLSNDFRHFLSLQSVHDTKAHARQFYKAKRNTNVFNRKDIFLSCSTVILHKDRSQRSVQANNDEEIGFMGHCDIESETTTSDDDGPDQTLCKNIGKIPFIRNTPFLLLMIGSVLTQMAQFIPMVFLGDYGKLIGLDGRDVATLFVIFGVVNTAGRLVAGCIAYSQRLSSLFICNFGTLVCAVACLLFWLCTTFQTLAIFMSTFGFFIGFFAPMQIQVTLEYVGLDSLTSAFGLITMAKGPAAIAGPPLAGGLYQFTKDYSYSNIFAGGLFLLTVILQSLMPFCGEPFLESTIEVVGTKDLGNFSNTEGVDDIKSADTENFVPQGHIQDSVRECLPAAVCEAMSSTKNVSLCN